MNKGDRKESRNYCLMHDCPTPCTSCDEEYYFVTKRKNKTKEETPQNHVHGELPGKCQICELRSSYESLTAQLSEEKAKSSRLESEVNEWQEAEHALSDAYLRIREKLSAWNTPNGPTREEVWSVTEKSLDQLKAQVEQLQAQNREMREGLIAIADQNCFCEPDPEYGEGPCERCIAQSILERTGEKK